MRLILVGNIPVDLVLRVPALPGPGADLTATSIVARPGGGFHVLSAAARAGLPGVYAGAHGDGQYGDRVRAALDAIHAVTLQPPTPGTDTGLVVVLVDDAGERTFVSAPDAVPPYSAGMLARVHPTEPDLVYVSGYSLGLGRESVPLAEWVGRLDARIQVFCDLGPRGVEAPDDVLRPVLDRVDWLGCNEREAALLSGVADPGAAAGELRRRTGHAAVLVRAGAAGCWLALPDRPPELVESAAGERVVDTNGAGDTHSGSFLAALAAGMPPRRAVEAANTAAASWVARPSRGG